MIHALLLLLAGEVVYPNLQTNTSTSSRSFASPTTIWAQQFTATEAFRGVTNTRVNLRLGGAYSGSASFNVFLARDATGTPDNIIGVLGGGNWQDLGTAANGTWDQSGSALFADQSAGNYWLMVETTDNSSLFLWNYGGDLTAGQTAYFNGTAWTYPNSNNSLGAYVQTVAIPEPGTLLMALVALILIRISRPLFSWWREKCLQAV